MIVFAAGFLSCTVEGPLEPDQIENADTNKTVTLGIKPGGSDWLQGHARISDESLKMVETTVYYGYSVVEVHEHGHVLTESGVTTNIDEVEIEFNIGQEYQIRLSSATFEDKYDLSPSRIFEIREPVYRWPVFRKHTPAESRGNTRTSDPFGTRVRDAQVNGSTITHWRFESDKFIGLEQLVIEEQTEVLEIDLYRFSAGLNFEIENLQEGKVELVLDPNNVGEYIEGGSVRFSFSPDSTSIYDLRPYKEVRNFDERYIEEILSDPDSNEMEYAVLGYYIIEDEEGNVVSSKRILNTSLIVRRNYNLTYVIDMSDFDLTSEEDSELGSGPRLNYVDEELIEGETIRLN